MDLALFCRAVVQIPWAVNALAAAHSIPGKAFSQDIYHRLHVSCIPILYAMVDAPV